MPSKKASPGQKLRKPGATFTKKLTRGPNKGDTVSFKVAKGGKQFPTKVRKDVGSKNKSRVGKLSKRKK